MNQSITVFKLTNDLCRKFPLSKGQLCPQTHFSAGPHQTFPSPHSPVRQQQHFAGSTSGQPLSQKPGGKHPGVI